MTLWSHVCCVGYGIHARTEALWHLVRGHRLEWRGGVDLWTGHTGCITCVACPESSDGQSDVVFWSRYWRWINWIGEIVCGAQGHRELRHPQRWSGADNADGEPIMVDVEHEWYCYRCGAHVEREAA